MVAGRWIRRELRVRLSVRLVWGDRRRGKSSLSPRLESKEQQNECQKPGGSLHFSEWKVLYPELFINFSGAIQEWSSISDIIGFDLYSSFTQGIEN